MSLRALRPATKPWKRSHQVEARTCSLLAQGVAHLDAVYSRDSLDKCSSDRGVRLFRRTLGTLRACGFHG